MRRKPPAVPMVFEDVTARLYKCGHEPETRDADGPPAETCPHCGADKSKQPDARWRRARSIA